ncbi:MAG: type I restriction-modification system subunit M N-terminal domain-containing protein [Eggerthella lenta]
MSEELQQKLRSQLWTVANTLRGNMSASDFMYFTLGFIFYKYLSEKIELYANEELKEDGMTFKEAWESDDEELKVDLKEACVQDLGYFVEPEYLYSTIISMIDRRENILPALERSLRKSRTAPSVRKAKTISAVSSLTSISHLPSWARRPTIRIS